MLCLLRNYQHKHAIAIVGIKIFPFLFDFFNTWCMAFAILQQS